MEPEAEDSRYLLGRLAVLEARVQAAIARRRHADPDPDDGFRGLYITDEQADRLLRSEVPPLRGDDPDIDDLEAAVERDADAVEAQLGRPPRLRRLIQSFGLSGLDAEIILVAVAPDLDPRFEKAFGYLHDDVTRRRASPGLALALAGAGRLDAAARTRFSSAMPLVRHGLVLVEEPDRPFLTRSLRVPDRVTAHLLGHDEPDDALRDLIFAPPPIATEQSRQLARVFAAGINVAYLRQRRDLGAQSVAAAAFFPQDCLIVDVGHLANGVEPGEVVDVALREARLLDRPLIVGPVDHLETSVIRRLAGGNWPVVMTGGVVCDPGWADPPPHVLDLAPLETQHLSAAAAPDVGIELGSVLSAFRLGPEQQRRALASGRAHAVAEGVEVAPHHLAAGARLQNNVGLERLARRVEANARWDDIVLPSSTLADLHHLTSRVAHRRRVLDEWGLRRGGGRGEGITALFAGESGTGKTLAAEVIAGELGLDLYVIDLSTVIDKYIGETEKNLERIFVEAEGVNGVLFFDEADALFGKRSEVSDARDRYANVEIAYLLQRMETFDGLAVLASNIRANIDEAFARRLSLMVDFPTPDAFQRKRLWEQHLSGLPLHDDVDHAFCATAFELAGGNVRNIAVTAAYLASTNGQVVTMQHVIKAVHFEYRKLGRLCLEAEFGPYYGLVRTGERTVVP